MKISIQEIKDLCITKAQEKGLTKEQAEILVEEYLDGELRGRKCHGFAAFPKFAIKKLKTFGKDPKIIKEEDCYMLVDGQGGMGQLVLHDIFPKLIEKAKAKGIAMLGIHNMHSYLMPGTYARKAAENDLIAEIYNYGGAPRICPTGSIDPIFATNPIAVGIPTNDSPVVIDMATSAIAMGKVRLAKRLGEKLPQRVAVDKDGNSTTNPAEAMDGAILPFDGHKGSALAFMVEVFSRALFDIPIPDVKGENPDVKGSRGFLFILFDPSKFGDLSTYKSNVSDLIKKIKNSRKAKGVEEIFVPGEHSDKLRQENLKKGYLEIEDKLIEDIKAL
ncbi:Ldh family oxidoreductase [Thermoproteota archaeon]